jgi:hypothetical protein
VVKSAVGYADDAINAIGSAFTSFGQDLSSVVDVIGSFFSSL